MNHSKRYYLRNSHFELGKMTYLYPFRDGETSSGLRIDLTSCDCATADAMLLCCFAVFASALFPLICRCYSQTNYLLMWHNTKTLTQALQSTAIEVVISVVLISVCSLPPSEGRVHREKIFLSCCLSDVKFQKFASSWRQTHLRQRARHTTHHTANTSPHTNSHQ